MDYLECMESFHGELNASNVFLTSEQRAKIGNFGFNGRFKRSTSDTHSEF